MKSTFLTLLSIGIFFTGCKSQSKTKCSPKDIELINSIFDKVEVQGVDTKQNLLYGYFFLDKDKTKLEKLRSRLTTQSYQFVATEKKDNGEFMLQVEKIEQHSRQSLCEREQDLRELAIKYNVTSFDGFDIGNADPTKPLVSNDEFIKFMATKKGNELFDLGIKLYDFEINDKAEIVFKECIKQSIKLDTASYKLGNILLAIGKVDEGVTSLERATKFNPTYLNAHFNLGATCYENRKFEKSIHYYQEADKLKPNDDRIIYGIAASQYAIKQYNKSLENCRKALEINNENENAKTLMGMLKGKTN
jgi:tetratricopeptide (TPR) repeat protein